MAYTTHYTCKLPENLNLPIWKYMDFTKFISLLEEQALFFTNITSLKDPFEGFLSNPTVESFMASIEDLPVQDKQVRKGIIKRNLAGFRKMRNYLYVSSWHMNDNESMAMWKLYLKSNEGIAIQSTIKSMINSFSHTEEDVYIGVVDYIDYDNQKMPWKNIFYPALHKRKNFEHEKEIRAIVFTPPVQKAKGKYTDTDLNVLIESVYISPNSPQWLFDLINKIMKRYNLNKAKCYHSGLLQMPVY
jgi:hypothetical protein